MFFLPRRKILIFSADFRLKILLHSSSKRKICFNDTFLRLCSFIFFVVYIVCIVHRSHLLNTWQ